MSGRGERTIGEVAQFVTSRNARPFLLTLDIVFADQATYRTVKSVRLPDRQVRANVRVMRWFVNEMQRQSRLYTQGRGLHLTEDFRESAAAFAGKRKPAFKDR